MDTPLFLVLSTADCQQLLDRNNIGRLAFSHEGVVDIEPLGYVFQGSWLFMRSAYGTKLAALSRNPFVAFQVDEIESPFDWRSVVVHGTIYMLPADGAPIERREFDAALKALRSVIPETLTQDDPAPARQILYGLHIDQITGRMACTGSENKQRRKPQPARKAPKRPGPRDTF